MNESNFSNPQTYIAERVDEQLDYYEKAANREKRRFTRTQSAIIVIGLLVPVVVNLPDTMGGTDLSPWIKPTATLLSLSLAILNGILNFRKFGDLWLTYRMTEELLKQEKYLFLTSAGRYQDKENAYSLFVESVESIISSEHNRFRALIDEARRPSRADSQSSADADRGP
jgi:hypothetical protein